MLIAIGMLLSACNGSQPGQVLFADDFSNPESGFQRHSDADAVADYVDGQYKIEVFAPQLNAWTPGGPVLADVRIEINARTVAGSENNLYGLVCRYRDGGSFYFLVVSADGYYAIGKVSENQEKKPQIALLGSKVYERSDKIAKGNAPNHLAAVCAGSTLSLSVNGSPLAQVTDSDLKSGQVGLYAGTFDEADTDVRFDDLVVTRP
jgi:hypothetical protein